MTLPHFSHQLVVVTTTVGEHLRADGMNFSDNRVFVQWFMHSTLTGYGRVISTPTSLYQIACLHSIARNLPGHVNHSLQLPEWQHCDKLFHSTGAGISSTQSVKAYMT